jgi:hypothetical protein
MQRFFVAATLGVGLLVASYPAAAERSLSWTFLSYQEAVWLCGEGNLQACDAMYAYEIAGVRRRPMSVHDFIR